MGKLPHSSQKERLEWGTVWYWLERISAGYTLMAGLKQTGNLPALFLPDPFCSDTPLPID
jgi:hypothetical protein